MKWRQFKGAGHFGDFSNFTFPNKQDSGSQPTESITTGTINLINGSFQARSIFCNTPQSIAQFTASFTYQTTASNSAGACFVAQNSAAGPAALGTEIAGVDVDSYTGIGGSFAISLDFTNTTSLFTDGITGSGGTSVSPLNFFSGDPINVTLTYNGSLLTENLMDATTSATFNTFYVVNLPSFVGGPNAFVGFTALTGNSFGGQSFSNFQFNVPEPASLSLLTVAGLGLLARRRQRTH